MVRLIIVVALAALLGIGAGMVQHNMYYGQADERLGDLATLLNSGADETSANIAPAVPSEPAAVVASTKPAADSSLATRETPKVYIEGGTTHDFGTMQQGSERKHTFTFKNIGKSPLELAVAGSSCRCTIGTLENSLLEPGQETGVTLTWKATGVLDEFSQTATIRTNDPDHRAVLLSVKGIVARTILIEPAQLNFGDITVGKAVTQSAFVFGYGEVPLEVKNVTWGDERTAKHVDIQITPVEVDLNVFKHHERAKGAARMDLTIKETMPLGALNSRLVLDTNIPNVSNVDLTVNGSVVGDIQFLPSPNFDTEKTVVEFGTIPQGQEVSRRVYLSIQGQYQENFTLEVAQVIPEGMKVAIDEEKRQLTRSIYPITCTIPADTAKCMYPGTNSGNFGKVIFKTNHPDIPEVRLNLRVIVE